MALNVNGVKLKKCNVNGVKCKRINVNGVKVWSSEETMSNLSLGPVYNYYAYHTTASGTSSSSWNLTGHDSLTLSWNASVKMSWSNEYGVGSTTRVYLKLSDGTTILLGSKTETLWGADTYYYLGDTNTIDLTSYTDTQLSAVYLYATLGDMTRSSTGEDDRHELNASTSNVIAS